MPPHEQRRRVVLTGAGRGLGLEFTRQLLASGRQVLALARRPEASAGLAALARDHPQSLRLSACDVGDDDSVAAARRVAGEMFAGVDLLINNAGLYGSRSFSLATPDFDDFRRLFEVNSLGPLRVSGGLAPLLRQGSRPLVVQITSLMGSIGDNASGGSWAYRVSKTALNMITRNLAHHLAGEGIAVVALHPGWVRTDMGGEQAPLSPAASVAAMVATIDRLDLAQTGGFYDREGQPLPW